MKIILKIIVTILIVLAIGQLYLLGISVSGSSHNISMASLENYLKMLEIALFVGSILILIIWFPWIFFRA